MNIEQFIASEELKFAVITKASWEQDEVAQSIAPSPRVFVYQDVEMVLLSISVKKVRELYEYVQGNVEYELTLGTGRVTLLVHSQVLQLLQEQDTINE